MRSFFLKIYYDYIEYRLEAVGRFFRYTFIPNIEQAFLFPLASLGFVYFQLKLANLYFHCYELKPKRPEKWLKKGIEKKIPKAYLLMGHFLHFRPLNKRSKKLYVQVFNLYKKAADLGEPFGIFNVYLMIETHNDILNLEEDGFSYLLKAAEKGCANAQYVLAKKYLEDGELEKGSFWMNKSAKNRNWDMQESGHLGKDEVKEWCKIYGNIARVKRLAESGDKDSIFIYSNFLRDEGGLGDAHEWHTKAAKAGHVRAMGEEGNFIIFGWVDGTLKDAFDYYVRAVDGGDKEANWGLGDCYFYGWGTERNLEKARFYLKRAARYGYSACAEKLKGITQEKFDKVDCDEALESLRKFYN